jgi:hypothetical protein
MMDLTRRKLWTLVLVGFVIGAASPALASLLSQMVATPSGVSVRAVDGPAATIKADKVDMTSLQADNNTLDLETSGGNITLSAQGHAQVQVDDVNGTWTNTSGLNVTTFDLTIAPDDKQNVTVAGDTSTLKFTSMTLDDASTDFIYAGASGNTTLTVTGLPASTEIAAVDQDTHEILDLATTDGSGTATWTMPNSEHAVELQTSDGGPTIHDGTADPAGNKTISQSSTTLSVDVSDPDMPADTLTVDFTLDGEHVGSTTVESNGTASLDVEVVESGQHTWSAEVTDEYGASTSSSFDFRSPDELRILNESSPGELVKGPNTTVELRFYYSEKEDDLIVERSTSDGTINMTGLPANSPFVVVADADGYAPRRIYVPALYKTQEVYLLPKTADFVSPKFTLQDYTGRFPPSDSVLMVQRSLNGSWKTVQADYLGATNQMPAQLTLNVRHRLVLLNTKTGKREKLGHYTPLESSEKTIQVKADGTVNLQGQKALITVSPDPRTLEAVNDSTVTVELDNQSLSLSSWNVSVVYNSSEGNTTLYEVSKSGPSGGTVTPTLDLSGRAGGNVTVFIEYRTDDGESGFKSVSFNVQERYSNRFSLLSVLGGVGDRIPAENMGQFTTMVSVIISILAATATAGYVRASTEVIGFTAVGTLAGFVLISWFPVAEFFGVGVTWIAFSAYRRGL